MRRTPDDWNSHWIQCEYCGHRYHASEYCEQCEQLEEEGYDIENLEKEEY